MEKDYLSSPSFKPEIIRSKSGAAAGLCGWVVNICKYFRIYQARPCTRAVQVCARQWPQSMHEQSCMQHWDSASLTTSCHVVQS